jgi:hypothetical protein
LQNHFWDLCIKNHAEPDASLLQKTLGSNTLSASPKTVQ